MRSRLGVRRVRERDHALPGLSVLPRAGDQCVVSWCLRQPTLALTLCLPLCPVLGLPYDCSLDIWSIGCTLFELYTSKILFPGRTNNQMLLHMMELKGKFNVRLIKKSQFGELHFDESLNFISVEVDKITGQVRPMQSLASSRPSTDQRFLSLSLSQNVTKILPTFKARDLRARLLPSASAQAKMKDDELKLLLSFVDLLDKCLHLDSSKRITPREALNHPFLRG